jgi:hypothetical protein
MNVLKLQTLETVSGANLVIEPQSCSSSFASCC